MRNPVLLAVDEDASVLEALKAAVPDNWRVLPCRRTDHLPDRGFHCALVDLSQPSGLNVLRTLRAHHPEMDLIATASQSERELMERSLMAGATRFLAKPLMTEEVHLTLAKISALLDLRSVRAGRWVGTSGLSREIERKIAGLRGEPGPILIEGETGTGKEICAELIHAQEDGGPFVRVNVAAIPENLFESEFFGHVRGAFTGADQHKCGLAEAADGGDLFLDEIEALSLPLQVKLLRFLESGEVRRVGALESTRVNVRVLAASNRDLKTLVSEGKFRADLLWRLSGRRLELPPLRARPEDIAELTRHFLGQDRVRRKEVADDAMQLLSEYPWPGNVRELRRVCEQLLLQAPLPLIRRADVLAVLNPPAPATICAPTLEITRGLANLVTEFESQVLQKALDGQNDIDDVARILKISRSSLYKKIKDHAITLKR